MFPSLWDTFADFNYFLSSNGPVRASRPNSSHFLTPRDGINYGIAGLNMPLHIMVIIVTVFYLWKVVNYR